MRRVWIWCCLVTMLLTGTGCGGGSAMTKSAQAPSGGGAAGYYAESTPSAPADVDSSGGGGGDAPSSVQSAPPATAPAPASASPGSSAGGTASAERSWTPSPAPRERPGLGTEWGETRVSHVHDVTFTRADEDRPFAVAQMFYNDRRGVEALAAYHVGHSALRDFTTAGGAITVSIMGSDGEPLSGEHVGDRNYVIGEQGQRYSIAITNHTGHRFEAVATVDGLDVINGRPGTLANRGYVLMPFATLEIDGFRQSHDAVAAFRFARVADSYAAQTGTARNVGVIGVAFFAESGDTFQPYTDGELHTRDTASPFPGSDPRFAQPPRR